MDAATLVDLITARADELGDRLACRFLLEGDVVGPSTELSYAVLARRARAIGARLQEQGAAGDRVLLLYPPGLDFVAGFLGSLFGGCIAVPTYPPDPARLEQTLPRLRAIARDCGARFLF